MMISVPGVQSMAVKMETRMGIVTKQSAFKALMF